MYDYMVKNGPSISNQWANLQRGCTSSNPAPFFYVLLHRALIGYLFRGLATRSGFTKQTDHPPAKTFELAVLSGKIQLFKFHHVFKDSAAAFH